MPDNHRSPNGNDENPEREAKRARTEQGYSKERRVEDDGRSEDHTSHQAVNQRLLAVAIEENGDLNNSRPERGAWLTQERKRYLEKENVDENSNPTEEQVLKQIFLPKVQAGVEFKDPIKTWVQLEPSSLCPAWKEATESVMPLSASRADNSLMKNLNEFRNESRAKCKIFDSAKAALEDKGLKETEEIAVYDHNCFIITTKLRLIDVYDKINVNSSGFRRQDVGRSNFSRRDKIDWRRRSGSHSSSRSRRRRSRSHSSSRSYHRQRSRSNSSSRSYHRRDRSSSPRHDWKERRPYNHKDEEKLSSDRHRRYGDFRDYGHGTRGGRDSWDSYRRSSHHDSRDSRNRDHGRRYEDERRDHRSSPSMRTAKSPSRKTYKD